MAMHAKPTPTNPYNPLPAPAHPLNDSTDAIRYPSPFIPIRVPVFAPVLWLNDRLVHLLSVGSGGRSKRYTGSARGGLKTRGRGLSDSTVESVEEGATESGGFGRSSRPAMNGVRMDGLSERRKMN